MDVLNEERFCNEKSIFSVLQAIKATAIGESRERQQDPCSLIEHNCVDVLESLLWQQDIDPQKAVQLRTIFYVIYVFSSGAVECSPGISYCDPCQVIETLCTMGNSLIS